MAVVRNGDQRGQALKTADKTTKSSSCTAPEVGLQ